MRRGAAPRGESDNRDVGCRGHCAALGCGALALYDCM